MCMRWALCKWFIGTVVRYLSEHVMVIDKLISWRMQPCKSPRVLGMLSRDVMWVTGFGEVNKVPAPLTCSSRLKPSTGHRHILLVTLHSDVTNPDTWHITSLTRDASQPWHVTHHNPDTWRITADTWRITTLTRDASQPWHVTHHSPDTWRITALTYDASQPWHVTHHSPDTWRQTPTRVTVCLCSHYCHELSRNVNGLRQTLVECRYWLWVNISGSGHWTYTTEHWWTLDTGT